MGILTSLAEPPAGVWWSAPPDTESEFSIEDPLAFDYLSQQVGLWLFPKLTTRTNRAQNYVVVLYGLHMAQLAIDEYGYAADDDTRTRLFERWERFWALATMEFREGVLERGDLDTMRGVRGANRNWRAKGQLSLDFPLISRQSELGSLGAYLSSLRSNGLVYSGTLRPTEAAMPIIQAFWGESGKSKKCVAYSLESMDLNRLTLERKFNGISLAKIGQRTRLSCLTSEDRCDQQERLWRALFAESGDLATLPLAMMRIDALAEDVCSIDAFFDGVLNDRWRTCSDQLKELVSLAVRYRQTVTVLLEAFDALYGHIYDRGIADRAMAANDVFTPARLYEMRTCSAALREMAGMSRFSALDFHGRPFLQLLNELGSTTPTDDILSAVLRYHTIVQRTRRGAAPWIAELDGKLVLQLSAYRSYDSEVRSPNFKLNAIDGLLQDLGKVPC